MGNGDEGKTMTDVIDLASRKPEEKGEAHKTSLSASEANDVAQAILLALMALEGILESHRASLMRAGEMPGGDGASKAVLYLDSARRCLQEAKFPVYREAIRLTWEAIKNV
jgi:hypothetical protein